MIFEKVKNEIIKALNDMDVDSLSMYDFEDTVSIDISLKKPIVNIIKTPNGPMEKITMDIDINKPSKKTGKINE